MQQWQHFIGHISVYSCVVLLDMYSCSNKPNNICLSCFMLQFWLVANHNGCFVIY